jgi:hypothetical protein
MEHTVDPHSGTAASIASGAMHPLRVSVAPALTGRNRLTCAFRPLLAIPHMLLVGAPVAFAVWAGWPSESTARYEWGSTGVLGAVAGVAALISWFAIVFAGRHPDGLWNLAEFYLRWRVRAVAYVALLRDEYPPFGDGPYGAALALRRPAGSRNRWTVGFRILLALPQIFTIAVLGVVWAITTLLAWFSILFTGNYPPALYDFGVGVLRWSTRVEAYLLLLHDEYPPFSLEQD